MGKLESKGTADIIKKSLLIVPALLMLLAFFIVPIVQTVYFSFTNLALTGSAAANLEFVGIENYKRMTIDPDVVVSIKNTLVFLVGSLAGQTILGFTLAYCMQYVNSTVRRIVGPIVLAGWIMPEIVVAICGTSFFSDAGTLNIITRSATEWLYKMPMLTVVAANIWHGTAFSMMNFQSALDSVSGDTKEAAIVDGANGFQTLVRIIIPQIKNAIGTNTMLNTLQTLGVFGLIYAMTGGGPGTKTMTLPIFMYNQAFKSFNLGYGTAISMIILALGILLSVLYTRLAKND